MSKRLYFLHIPKTGGLVLRFLGKLLDKRQIASFSTYGGRFREFEGYTFINSHLGITPMEKGFDTAVLLREPLDRVVSHFTWLMMNHTFEHLPDYEGLTLEEIFRKYLFEDDFFDTHKNIQTRFLTSKINDDNFEKFYTFTKPYPIKYETKISSLTGVKRYEYDLFFRIKDWFLEPVDFSIEFAKENLDKCLIVGTTENHDKFMQDVLNWFKNNLDLDLKNEFNELVDEQNEQLRVPYYNYGKYTDEMGNDFTTANFKAMLTEEEIAQIYADNSLDLELYEYAKAKLQ